MASPAPPERRRFTRTSDWHNFINEIAQTGTGADLYALRRACYADIETIRERPVIVYAVKFPGAHPAAPISIDLNDVDGFTDLVGSIPDSEKKIDVILHSPGGSPEATERIVGLLRSRFDEVTFLIPHSAYSAATMLALSGNDIILHPSATLGPIDPQINGTPARSIRRGFDKVRELPKDEGPEALPAYIPLIEKHSLELLEICDDSLKLSKELACEWMREFMFAADEAKNDQINAAVDYFSDYDEHKTHARPLTLHKLGRFNLRITHAEQPLRDLLREAHILINGFFSVTPFVKIYENSTGLSWGHQFQQVFVPPQPHPQQQG